MFVAPLKRIAMPLPGQHAAVRCTEQRGTGRRLYTFLLSHLLHLDTFGCHSVCGTSIVPTEWGGDKHTLLYMRGSYVLEGPQMAFLSVRPHTKAHETLNWFEHNVFPLHDTAFRWVT